MRTSAVRPFRFGVTSGAVGDLASWAALARRVEDLGYAALLVPDTVRTAAPFAALAAAAAVTQTLHIGTWVICEPLRPPATLAWEVRTLRELCGVRFEPGLGAGRPGAEQDARVLGVPFGSPAQRIERLMSTVDLLRQQAPGTPILLAASGPRLLALAGRRADTVAVGWPPQTDEAAAAARIALVAEAAADRGAVPELAAGLVAVGDVAVPYLRHVGTDPRRLADQGAVTVVHGPPARMAGQLLHRRDTLGISYVTVPAEALEAFAPVVELLAGR
jgi:probable F420-dependent oxidoreductase